MLVVAGQNNGNRVSSFPNHWPDIRNFKYVLTVCCVIVASKIECAVGSRLYGQHRVCRICTNGRGISFYSKSRDGSP